MRKLGRICTASMCRSRLLNAFTSTWITFEKEAQKPVFRTMFSSTFLVLKIFFASYDVTVIVVVFTDVEGSNLSSRHLSGGHLSTSLWTE